MEFMGVRQSVSQLESDLETAIINNLQKFLLEMGKGFSFVGRQMRICTETTDFYIDLVFYNFILKCFVVIYMIILPTVEELQKELERNQLIYRREN